MPAAALSLAASLALVAGAGNVPLLFLGRMLAGLSNGAVFAAGTAWLRESSRPPFGDAGDQTAARRAAVAMTGGFGLGPLAAGLALGAVTAQSRQAWLLVPCSIVLGAAYGLCLVAGLAEVQQLAGRGSLAGLTAVYYVLTYLGFAAPYLLALAARLASYAILLAIIAALALATAALISRRRAGAAAVGADPGPRQGVGRPVPKARVR